VVRAASVGSDLCEINLSEINLSEINLPLY
jgi:hypothetical protein